MPLDDRLKKKGKKSEYFQKIYFHTWNLSWTTDPDWNKDIIKMSAFLS